VFASAGDALALGNVASLSHPEGNTTGFANNFASFGGKWLELLKEAAPRLQRVGILYYSENLGGLFPSIEAASAALAVTTHRIPYHDAQEIERAVEGFAAEPNGGLIIHPPTPVGENRNAINLFTTRYRLPTICGNRSFIADGGLMSYGPDLVDQFRQAASYVDRILRGAKPTSSETGRTMSRCRPRRCWASRQRTRTRCSVEFISGAVDLLLARR
jgi:putative tryptophan/tyrosine transport system substrate-binding protein